ncbi:hypothetical protein F2Q70_00032257 [Brassica cretica]|uniref:FRIGIDA-like protein n=1 Tax=Brassica cretica TaxID=69181 RepID=A0A8S9FKU1_BRACR|nr:hypothetical protein F2Q70_00032257 [Brassica cretica]
MGSLMEKTMSGLRLLDLSKRNFKRTLDSLEENARSLILLSIQWKEIEGFCDSTKAALEERAKELEAMEESLKVRALELEAKEKEVEAKASDLEKKDEALGLEEMEKRREEFEVFTRRIESVEKVSDENVKELEEKAKELDLKVRELQQKQRGGVTTVRSEFEPLVSLLAKNIGTSVSMPTNCSTFRLSADDLVKRNEGLARTIPCLDPAKMLPREIQTQNHVVASSSVPVQSPQILPRFHMHAAHAVIHNSYIATHSSFPFLPTSSGSAPNPQVVDVETHQASGSTAFQGQPSYHAGSKRPRVDPGGPRPVIRPCFNPPQGYGRF